MTKAIFLIQADDKKGLLASTVDFFYGKGFNILHCQQHTDSNPCHASSAPRALTAFFSVFFHDNLHYNVIIRRRQTRGTTNDTRKYLKSQGSPPGSFLKFTP